MYGKTNKYYKVISLQCYAMLSHFSRVRLCVTPETASHKAPPSLGFSRQEHWSGLPWPSPMHESEKWKWRCSVVSDSSWPHGLQPTRLLHPWDFPGKSAGVGCHCLVPFCLYMLNKTSQWNTWLSKVLKQKEELDKVVRHENCFLSAWLRKLYLSYMK